MANGAQLSDTVHNFLVEKKVITGKKINVLPKKTPIKSEAEIEAAKKAAETPKAAPVEEEKAPESAPIEESVVEETKTE